MGSSSVRRAMSNRSHSDNVKSFSALTALEPTESSDDGINGNNDNETRYSYNRSKSVAACLPRLGDDVSNVQENSQIPILQDNSMHETSYDNKSLSRKKRHDSLNNGSSAFGKLLKQVKNIVSKDKHKRPRLSSDPECSKLSSILHSKSSLVPSKLRHQSQSCLTPKHLKLTQHHSTPRLFKHS